MPSFLRCIGCGERLTRPVTLLSTKDPAVTPPVHRDGQPLSVPGVAYKSWRPQQWAPSGERVPLDFTPQFWLNPADVAKSVLLTRKRGRTVGCCGLDGTSGPNQLCRCGAEIGTLRSDCWTDHVFVPEPGATEWIDEDEGP